MTNSLDYSYNDCYYLNPTFNTDNENKTLDDFLNSNFTKTENINDITNLDDCKDQARLKQKDFFLVSNFNYNQNTTNLEYNCYIPNFDAPCDFSNIKQLVDPFNTILEKLLGTSTNRKSVDNIMLLPSNNYSEDILNNAEVKNDFNNAKCYKYTNSDNDTMFFGKKKSDNEAYFALYKTDFIENPNTDNILNNADINNMYDNYEKHEINFTTNFSKSNFQNLLDNIENKFKYYLCDKPNSNLNNNKERDFDESIIELTNYYDTMFDNLNLLSKDISNLYIITKYDLYRLTYLEKKINLEKKKLKNLLGFDGAGNGKLFDTKYLKNLKLSETIILSLIIIFLIYFYAKKK